MGPRRGRLVVLEGAEGVGKTTQVARLVRRLGALGVPCDAYREPGGTPLGDEIRGMLLEPGNVVVPRAEALLFMAARAQLVARVCSRLAEGITVVLDRFFLSTYAYQIAGRGLPPEEIRAANRLATEGLVPDLTLLLAADLEVSRRRMVARGDLDRMEREDAAFHERVGSAFLGAVDPTWQRKYPEIGSVVRVDADGSPEVVEERILAALGARLPETFGGGRESKQGQ